MNRRVRLMGVAALGLSAVVLTASLRAGPERSKTATAPREVNLVGKITDLHSYMTAKPGTAASAKVAQQAIRSGVPAVIETEDGIVLVGQGEKGPMRTLLPFAGRDAELKGRLYEKDGLRYIDIVTASRPQRPDEEGEGEHGAEEEGDDPDAPPDE
ncbi:MAG: hypothetical protein AABZ47_17010 [Planctomycetota bacterium]